MLDRKPRSRRRHAAGLALGAALVATPACADELPGDLDGYAERCIPLNQDPIAPYDGDPHKGDKRVYVCDVALEDLVDPSGAQRLPYPVGAVVVKESTKDFQGYPWLIAVARKGEGGWSWAEYTRNFESEPFYKILASESVCTGCHEKARTADWIFTRYDGPPPGG
ncbi:MAG: cytochrome P460 family protein [Myxococcales bacterium]|nr:cytochrome P460 family protein [Myxococcales bacterium]